MLFNRLKGLRLYHKTKVYKPLIEIIPLDSDLPRPKVRGTQLRSPS